MVEYCILPPRLEDLGIRMALLPQQRRGVLVGLLPTHHPEERHGLFGRVKPDHEFPTLRPRCGVDVRNSLGRRSIQEKRVDHHIQLRVGSHWCVHDGIRDESTNTLRGSLFGRIWR